MRPLAARTWPEVVGAQRLLVVMPLGSCEQHGPHLPLGTDTMVAVALAERLAAARTDVVLAPPLAYGASGEHAAFPGTLSLGTEALATVVVELIRSADQWRGLVVVNGHGGNADALASAQATITAEGRHLLSWSPWVRGGDAHAGRTETSLLLALAPEAVAVDRAAPGATRPLAELWAQLRAGGAAAVSPNGVLGDPTGATPAEGHALLSGLVADLVAVVEHRFGPSLASPPTGP